MTLLYSIPPVIEVGTGEVKPYGYDVTNAILQGDTVASAAAYVFDENTQANVTGAISGTPTVNGNIITVWFMGSVLVESDSRYRVIVTFQANGKTLQRASWISVPF